MYNARWPARWFFKSVAGCGTGTTGTVDVRVKIVELQCVPRPAGANMTPTSYQGNAPPSHLTLQFDTGTVPPGTESVVWIVSESLNSVISDTTVYVAGNGTVEVPAPVLNDGHYDVLVEFNGLPDVDGARIGFDVWGNPGGGGGGATILWPGQSLYPGQSIASPSGQFVLTYQADANLVLYNYGSAHWAINCWPTCTNIGAAGITTMQNDGNFVVYNAGGSPVWHAGTNGNSGAYLAVQDNGRLVVYSGGGTPLWSSGP